ncbi:hypothetical protein TNCT_379551 [Trichonephila clavata]|uniref:Uncharacterized protein n=1 Tax=Trichonephila clavata TaxID=2740835 RepID=A0A8X6FK80_TRICU|nr:hypothetical protein TNCT_379551 [Trichonephila clavata]
MGGKKDGRSTKQDATYRSRCGFMTKTSSTNLMPVVPIRERRSKQRLFDYFPPDEKFLYTSKWSEEKILALLMQVANLFCCELLFIDFG